MSVRGKTIRISGIVRQSIVDGAGLRLVVFTQGCPHACKGCHNPDTHDFAGGYDCALDKILEALDQNPLLAGVTLSGGEPFARAGELVPLARAVRERGKNIWAYSGYLFEELLEMGAQSPEIAALLALCDVLVDGPYIEQQRDLTLVFRGSRNQRVLDVPASLREKTAVEMALEP